MSVVEVAPRTRFLRGRAGSMATVRLLGYAGTAFFALVVAVAILAPLIAPADPLDQDLSARFAPPFWAEGGSWSHPLGTDQLGRDVLSRLMHGGRISLLVGVSATAASALIGTTIGLVSGYFAGLPGRLGGWVDRLLMMSTEMALAIPGVLLAIAAAALFGASLRNLIVILVIFGWVVFARLTRGIVLSLHRRSFVESAVVLGAGHRRVLLRHMLPYVLPQVVVVAALQVGFMILVESALSYLGLGVQPPKATWGRMVSEGREILNQTPWVAVFSGLAITLTVLSVNFMADLLRTRLTRGAEASVR
ncbi:MAG: ABC transporter permease [Gaiellaceae bacterium]